MQRILEKLIRLPMDVMISSMENMTRTMHEIQKRSEARDDEGPGETGGASLLGNAPQLAITPFFEMYKIPTSGLASGFKTISRVMDEIRQDPATDNRAAAEDDTAPVDADIVPLDEEEAVMERRATLFAGDLDVSGNTLWQIGRPGRKDYTGSWTRSFDYHVGKDVDPLNAPRAPHLLTVHDGPRSGGATERLNVYFHLMRDYRAGALALSYDRWGGEKDRVYVDDELLAPVRGAGRGRLRHVALSLGTLSRGDHVITITTCGDTIDGEHRIDCLRVVEVRSSARVA